MKPQAACTLPGAISHFKLVLKVIVGSPFILPVARFGVSSDTSLINRSAIQFFLLIKFPVMACIMQGVIMHFFGSLPETA